METVAYRAASLLFCLMLLSVAFAGCAEREEAKAQEVARRGATRQPAANLTPIEKRIDERLTSSAQPSMADWTVLTATAGPSGNLTGFRWTIPAGALMGGQFQGQSGVFLEIAPIVVSGATITSWCVVVFREHEGKAVLVGDPQQSTGLVVGPLNILGLVPSFPGLFCSSDQELIQRELPQAENRSVLPAPVNPVFLRLLDNRLQELDNLFIVVAGVADKEADFGLGIRVLDQYPTSAVLPSETLDTFLLQVGGARARSAPVLGRGNGFQAAEWIAFYGITSTFERRSGTLQFGTPLADARPAGAVWNFNVSSALDSTDGWSFVAGSYSSYCATGRWVASADLNGNPFGARNLILMHPICGAIYPFIAEVVLVGLPMFAAYGGGAGPSKASLEILSASAVYESLVFRHVALGTSLETLLGVPPAGGQYAYSGAVRNLPP